MSFFAIEIDPTPAFGWQGGPEFSTNIKAMANGREKRNADWAMVRHKFTAPFSALTPTQYLAVKKVFLICMGQLHTFLQRDWGDYQATNDSFGTGDGATTIFQLSKISSAGGGTYTRVVTKPDTLTGVQIRVNGTLQTSGVTVDATTGQVTFSSPPANGAALTWTGQFWVQVRFAIDSLPFSIGNKSSGAFRQDGSVDLIEVLAEDD
jgi:uncharacterized protein (TIGR02217 family)